ncbi:hypothetical protein F4803DRAFT_338289 [Xylaria telfairii]|nr:hypothetical protein F4803DRAFT_338289 [Xylaria telfairii]
MPTLLHTQEGSLVVLGVVFWLLFLSIRRFCGTRSVAHCSPHNLAYSGGNHLSVFLLIWASATAMSWLMTGEALSLGDQFLHLFKVGFSVNRTTIRSGPHRFNSMMTWVCSTVLPILSRGSFWGVG